MNLSWILLLHKEQCNGLEAIGSIVKEKGEESTPMDEPEDETNTTTIKSEGDSDKESEEEPEKQEETDNGQNSDNDDDDENEIKNPEEDQTDTDNDVEDESSNDPNSENVDQSTPVVSDTSKDPNFIQNRRILLSNNFLKLYGSIKDSIDIIANGISFNKKPVILDELNRLSDIVETINESINKESDHKVLLLKYAVCIKTYNRIMNEI